MVIGIRPPADSNDGMPAKRHPRLVHDEMEAIFGVPSSLNSIRRGYTASVNTHAAPEVEPGGRMGSMRLWISILVMSVLVLTGAGFLAWMLFGAPAHRSAEFALSVQESPSLPAPDKPVPVTRSVAEAAPVQCAGRVDAGGNCIVQPLPAAPVEGMRAAADPAAAALQNPSGAVTEGKPVAEATKPSGCDGTGYEHAATCPPAIVLKADSALSAAYAAAISANVDPSRLAFFSQRWSQLRETAAANPDPTIDEFANMTSELNALTLAAASRKP